MTEAASRRGQILFGIDAGRRFIDLGNGDPHAGLKGAQAAFGNPYLAHRMVTG